MEATSGPALALLCFDWLSCILIPVFLCWHKVSFVILFHISCHISRECTILHFIFYLFVCLLFSFFILFDFSSTFVFFVRFFFFSQQCQHMRPCVVAGIALSTLVSVLQIRISVSWVCDRVTGISSKWFIGTDTGCAGSRRVKTTVSCETKTHIPSVA